MEKRVIFRSAWLPAFCSAAARSHRLLLLAGGLAVWYSFLLQDAFGSSTQFVWFENYQSLLSDSHYYESFKVTALFSVLVAGFGILLSLVLAVMADRVVRGALAYKTLLIWPYAVAAAVAGVLWGFMFAPSIGIFTYVLKSMGVDWDWLINGDQAMLLSESWPPY
jgi:sn-glycerol 3-phosphate transport system permease protein